MNSRRNPLYSDPFVSKWLEGLTDKQKANRIHKFNKYLEWRKKTPKEILDTGLKEAEYIEQFKNLYPGEKEKQEQQRRATIVRHFLRFHGIPIARPKTHGGPRTWYFEDEPFMQKFLGLHRAIGSKKIANRALADYCQFRNLTPTQIIEETSEDEFDMLEVLEDFFKWRLKQSKISEKTTWQKVNLIIRFYRRYKRIKIEFESSEKPRFVKAIYALSRNEPITKVEIQKILEIADTRDSAIILGLWESGLSPADLGSITYKQIKKGLNLEDPEDVPICIIFPHQRKKNKQPFFCALGKQSLKFASLWIKQRTSGVLEASEKLTDQTIVFSTKYPPYKTSSPQVITGTIKKLCRLANIRNLCATDFRNTFNTKLKQTGMDKDDREMLMGHSLGIAEHYDISRKKHYEEEYSKYWKICFDITFEDEKLQSLEEETIRTKEELFDLRQTNAILSKLVLKLLKATQEGEPVIIDPKELEELEKTLK